MHSAFVRDIQGITGIRLARARRRHSQALLDGLGLPESFDLSALLTQVARQRGREVRLVPMKGAAAEGSPRGWWCPMHNVDVIFLDDAASGLYRQHIVLHEVGHMLWGHQAGGITIAPVLERAMPDLRWDNEAVTMMLERSKYDSPREHEAEVFATVAGVKILTGV